MQHYQILSNTSSNFRHPFASLKLNALTRTFTNKANSHLNPKTFYNSHVANQNYGGSTDKTFERERRLHTQCSQSKFTNLLLVQPSQSYESLSKRNTKPQFYKQNKTKRYIRTVKTDERILQNVMKTHQNHMRSPLHLQIYSLQIKDNSAEKKKILNNKQMFVGHSNHNYFQKQKDRVRSIQKKIRSFNVGKPSVNFFNDNKSKAVDDLNMFSSKPRNIKINKLVLQRKTLYQTQREDGDLCPWEPQYQFDMQQIHTQKAGSVHNPEQPTIKIKKRRKRK